MPPRTPPPAPAKTKRGGGAPAPAPATTPLVGADLLKAGLKALDDVRGEVAARHSRFFETLLGIDPDAGKRKAKELFGLSSFEDLFDERVARSLERIGIAQALADLREQIAALDARVKRLERQADKPPAVRKRPSEGERPRSGGKRSPQSPER